MTVTRPARALRIRPGTASRLLFSGGSVRDPEPRGVQRGKTRREKLREERHGTGEATRLGALKIDHKHRVVQALADKKPPLAAVSLSNTHAQSLVILGLGGPAQPLARVSHPGLDGFNHLRTDSNEIVCRDLGTDLEFLAGLLQRR